VEISAIIESGPSLILELILGQGIERLNDQNIDWLVLTDICASKAKGYLDSDDLKAGAEWSLAAVKLYEYLASHTDSESLSVSYEISSVRLRINAINVLGVKHDDELRSIKYVEDWFGGKLKLSKDIVAEKASNWMKLPKDEILYLRSIKNILSTLELVKDYNIFTNKLEMKAWIGIKNNLP
jgi:hypothetical protein